MLGLCCFVWAFSSCGEQNLLCIVVRTLVIAVASAVVELRLIGARASAVAAHRLSTCSSQAQYLQLTGSVLAAHRLSWPAACGIFLDKGLNLCLLH